MATIDINGIMCNFPKVPRGTLESYCVTSRTHYLAYKLSDNPLHNATISAMLASGYEFGAFARPPFFVQDEDGRAIVLLENPSARVVDTITTWLSWTIGSNHLYIYPFQKAIVEMRIKAEQDAKDTDRTIDLMRYDNLYKRTLTNGNPHNTPPSAYPVD